LPSVMRLLASLGLLVPGAIAVLYLAMPEVPAAFVPEPLRPIVIVGAAATAGVTLTAIVIFAYVRLRLDRLIGAAERIANGELDVEVSVPPVGLARRLAVAVNGAAAALSAKEHAATID